MALLPITLYGDKILRKKTARVAEVDVKTVKLIKDMFDTMKNAPGIGLAANQVGVDKRIFIADVSSVEGYENSKPMVFINPKIEKFSEEKSTMEEGCLSIPEIRLDIERPKQITVKFQDTELKEHSLVADGLLARVIQHECDHLNGILFTDKISDELKKKLKKDLNKIRHRKIEVEYPVSQNIDYRLK